MKKYLLTALLGAFCLFGFASATNFTFVGVDNYSEYSPDNFDLVVDYTFSVSDIISVTDNDNSCAFVLDSSSVYWDDCEFWYSDWEWSLSSSDCTFSAWNIKVGRSDWSACDSITISDWQVDLNGSWSGGSSSSSTWILNASWQAYLWNVLTSIQSVVSEFIPYMVYLALWVLVVTLWFVAVKWLLNYVSRKTTSIFKSKRR